MIDPPPIHPDEPGRYRPAYELVAEQILEHIVKNDLRPGDRLPTEKDMAVMLGVSRSVAREAVRTLATLGRLTVRKGAGITVASGRLPTIDLGTHLFLPADVDQVRMLFELRSTLEQQSSRLASQRATPLQVKAIHAAVQHGFDAANQDDFGLFRAADNEFHLAVAHAANNTFFESTIRGVNDLRGQVVALGLSGGSSGSLREAAEQHSAVADAIVAGDPEAAAASMLLHIDIARSQFQAGITAWLLDNHNSEPDLEGSGPTS